MRIVVFNPGDRKPQVRTIDGDLRSMQNVVGGAMNIALLPGGNAIVSNKNAQIKNLEPNRLIDGHVVRGYFFVCRIFDEKFASITLIDAKNYLYNCRWPMAQHLAI